MNTRQAVVGMAGKHWTHEEEARLRAWTSQAGASRRALADALGRTPASVSAKVQRLGLATQDRDSGYSQTQLAALLGVDGHMVARWRARGWLHGTGSGKQWRYSRRAVRAFLRAHSTAIDPARVNMRWLVELLAGGSKAA